MRFHHTWLPVCLVSVIPFCGFTAGFETDDFDDGVRDATKWVLPDVVSRNGSFAETNSHLEFVATQPLPSYETATAAWRYGLSPFADWSVSVDVTLPPVPQSTNLIFASWELVSDAQNPDNGRRFIYFRSDPDAQQTRFAYDRVVVGSTNAGSSQASLRLR